MKKRYAQISEIYRKFSDYTMDIDIEQDIPFVTHVVLTPNNWNNDFLQTVTVNGILADETAQTIYINPIEKEDNIDIIGACNVYAISQGVNTITFKCDIIPEKEVEFYIDWEDIDYITANEVYGKFYIDDQVFNFTFGMTLIDWCASEYNTKGYWINENGMWNADLSKVNYNLHSSNSIILNSNMAFYLEPAEFNPIATIIEFYIENTKYQAEANMTWRSWCSSKYNTTIYYNPIDGNSTPIFEVAEDVQNIEKVRNCITGNTIVLINEVAPDDPIYTISYTLNTSINLPMIKTFVINSKAYNYIVNMDLETWCNSKYNIDKYYLNENGLWTSDGTMYNKNYNSGDIIITELMLIPMENYVNDANTGTFYIDTLAFNYPINTTWNEFVNNNEQFIVNNSAIKYNDNYLAYRIIGNIAEFVSKDDIIQNGFTYVLSSKTPPIDRPQSVTITYRLNGIEFTCEGGIIWDSLAGKDGYGISQVNTMTYNNKEIYYLPTNSSQPVYVQPGDSILSMDYYFNENDPSAPE